MYRTLELPPFPGLGELSHLMLSPDGEQLVAFWSSGTLTTWRVGQTSFERVLELYPSAPEHASLFVYDEDTYLICSSPGRRAIAVWDLNLPASTTLVPMATLRHQLKRLLVDPGGRHLLAREHDASLDQTRVVAWSLEYPPEGKPPARVLREGRAAILLGFDPCEERVALLREDERHWLLEVFSIYDPQDARSIRVDREGVVYSATFPIGARFDWKRERLISTYIDGTVTVTSLNHSESLRMWSLPHASIKELNRGPFTLCDRHDLYAIAHNHALKFWGVEDGALVERIELAPELDVVFGTEHGEIFIATDQRERWSAWTCLDVKRG